MTQLFKELTRRRLVRWLPISAMACIAMPLALNLVSARLAAINGESSFESPTTAASNKARLDVLMGAMKSFLPQYDGVELLKETAKRAADLAQADTQSQPANSGPVITDWAHHLLKNPSLYLKMILAVDLSISKGRIAEEYDFPVWLVSHMTVGQRATPTGQPVPHSTPRSTGQSAGTRRESNFINTHLPTSSKEKDDHERRVTPPLDPIGTSWDNVCSPPERVISEPSGVGEQNSLGFPSLDDVMETYFGGVADADTSYIETIQDLIDWA
ncbi:uncharacterized protein ColSpa_06089 [Colletotrichum spaethianum]|uniref:Uncharacterized protein n=1 Tax=Colletotrichum spaethianum TaxID=700344 RepID=A0AA37P260_9PEZI|nr:uncharacterized protein ColSpa_06089 [Colletotrichum spaethianum]GKT45908.1 hypothetical protein ColSpa_06089 [Colletotrichum spaethianum]